LRHEVPTEESQETAALYALGALSQHEARAFEAHLRQGCEVCQKELDDFAGVVDAMSADAAEVAPPAYLRDLLSARIEKEERLQPTGRAKETQEAQVYPFPEKARPGAQAQPRRSPFSMILPWAVAASLLIAFAYTFINWRVDHFRLQSAISQQIEDEDKIVHMSEQAAFANARANEFQQINAVLSSPQRSVIPLAGSDAAPNSSGNIYWDHEKNRWVVAANLPPAPAGKVYQLWFVTPEAKVSAGLIEMDQGGHGFATMDVPTTIGQIQVAAITLEPQGGSAQPTMPIYAAGKVAS
jgi:anti-sigma-K factor RskA